MTARSLYQRRRGRRVRLSSGSRDRPARLRVLILPEWYPSESDRFAGVFVRDQARAASRFHDVTVLVHDPQARRAGDPSVTDGIEDGLHTVRVRTRTRPGSPAGRVAFLLAAARLIRSLQRRGRAPDVVHAHVFSAGFIALLLAHGRYPVVVSEHHSDFIEGKVRGRDARVAHIVFRHADMVCPVSACLKAHLEQFEPSARYEVVPNVVDVEEFETRAERPSRRDGATRLLVVASLSRQKGIEYLLEALAEVHRTHPDFTLEVVGDGPRRRELEQRARSRLPSGVVIFHGSRSRAEVAAFMAQADVLVAPSIVETFGVAVIEAVAAGLPIIATRAVPDHERLEGRFGIIVPPHDPEALREAVVAMLEGGWTVPADAALELTRSFSEPVVSRRWDEIYRALVRTS